MARVWVGVLLVVLAATVGLHQWHAAQRMGTSVVMPAARLELRLEAPPSTNVTRHERTASSTGEAPRPPRFWFMGTRLGGFNNQLLHVFGGVAEAIWLKRVYVLPHFHEYAQHGHPSTGAFPFEDYFDPAALARIVPVATAAQFHEQCKRPDLVLSKLGRECTSWNVNDQSYPYPSFVGPPVEADAPTVLQLRDGRGPSCVVATYCCSQATDGGLFDPPPPELDFGTYPPPLTFGYQYDVDVSPTFRRIFAALQPSQLVLDARAVLVRAHEHELSGPFNAVHVRRGDFRKKCQGSGLCSADGRTSETGFQSDETLASAPSRFANASLPLFIASDEPDHVEAVLRKHHPQLRIVRADRTRATNPNHARQDVVGQVEQWICAEAAEFIGSHFSSWTATVTNRRRLAHRTPSRFW